METGSGLITPRSVVQIYPPLPNIFENEAILKPISAK
jgi:hypothetical protein